MKARADRLVACARPAPLSAAQAASAGPGAGPARPWRTPTRGRAFAMYNLRLLWSTLAVLWALAAADQGAADFHIERVATRVEGDTLYVDATIDYSFSEGAVEALDNGVPLTLVVHIQLRRAGDWVWNDSLVDQRLRYVIRYKPLSERYLVSRLPGEGTSYVTRDAAIAALGEIEGLQLASLDRLREETGPFELHVKAFLDIEELPVPLRPLAYLLPSWKLSSGWTKWPLAL